jgi:hypothetical protein
MTAQLGPDRSMELFQFYEAAACGCSCWRRGSPSCISWRECCWSSRRLRYEE